MKKTLTEIAACGGLRVTAPVGIIRCEPVWEFKPYRLKDYLLWCVLDGVGKAWIGGREMRLGPGTCLLIPPGSALTAEHDPKRRLRVFYLHLDFLSEQGRVLPASEVRQPSLPAVVTDLTAFESLARQVIEGHSAKTEAALLKRDLALRLILIHIEDASLAHPSRSDGTKLAAVLFAVKENPGMPWPVSAMAKQAGLSVSQTARRMRELTGQSPREFVIRTRIERARRLMEESSLSLKQIAESLGYSDVYFFHRQFKTVTGMTPGQWLRSLRRPTT